MKLVNEDLSEMLNEDLMGAPAGENSIAINQLKNIVKNAQSMLDILSTGAGLDPMIQSNIAVVDSKIQDAKNYIENESTEIPGQNLGNAEILDPIAIDNEPMDGMHGMDGIEPEDGMDGMDDEEHMPGEDSNQGMLPPPFPDEETDVDAEFDIDVDGDGSGDVNVLDIEALYNDGTIK